MKVKFAASILFTVLSLIIGKGEAPANVRIYAETMAVVDIHQTIGNESTYDVILCTFNGNLFSITTDEVEDILIGDLYSCVMSDNGTDFVSDDLIEDVEYCGFVDKWGYDPYRNQALFTFEK